MANLRDISTPLINDLIIIKHLIKFRNLTLYIFTGRIKK
ncbi:Outer membrane protein [Legionella pneumophila subsp. pneumophila LPE509]|nr:Outer membrane protein [Legionella pneumophila subsp. pneumophila LPE509]